MRGGGRGGRGGEGRKELTKMNLMKNTGNTKGGSITILLISCLTGSDLSLLLIKTKKFCSHRADSKPVKQEVNGTGILSPLVFPEEHHSSQPHNTKKMPGIAKLNKLACSLTNIKTLV